jgi:hypothetical protein
MGANHCVKCRLPPPPPPPPLRSVTLEPSPWKGVEARGDADDKPLTETTATRKRARAQHAHATTAGAGAPRTSAPPRAPRLAKGPQGARLPLMGSRGTGERCERCWR